MNHNGAIKSLKLDGREPYPLGKRNLDLRKRESHPMGRTSAIWQEIRIKACIVHKDKMSHNRLDKETSRFLDTY